ncbi:hypothetical protein EV664_102370 [Stakelama pacifica]|uniref:Uncharacterized protein n=1 Tax=Stakelama pacifica TaxID=517720 RepID=A0A4R6FV01_9SPHN|nr:hypothetical protein EV664_102370 [Stakelama pacifica]
MHACATQRRTGSGEPLNRAAKKDRRFAELSFSAKNLFTLF